MINIAMFDITLVLVFQTHIVAEVKKFLALNILWCAWTSCVKRHSFHRDRTGRNTFPLVVVVCHRTDTCSFVRRYCLTNRNRYLVVAWQSEWHNSASVTTGLVIRGPLLSPCGITWCGRDSAILSCTPHFIKPSCPAISTVKENCEDNDENLGNIELLSTYYQQYMSYNWFDGKTAAEWLSLKYFFSFQQCFTLFDQKKSERVRCCHVNQFRKISNCGMVFKNEKDSHAHV